MSLFPVDIWTSVNSMIEQPFAFFIDNHTLLRLQLNQILHLYTPNKAYAQPHEFAEHVISLSGRLRTWYQSLPPEAQFVRDATTFNMTRPSIPLHLVSSPPGRVLSSISLLSH